MRREKTVPTIDKRLFDACQRLRGLAADIEQRWHHGLVHHFVEEQVIQAHRGWKIEVTVRELEDYLNGPEEFEHVPLPPAQHELTDMLRRVIEECKGVRGIESPAAPSTKLLNDITDLLGREPPQPPRG